MPGLAKFKGCPDTDGDGLQDKYDDCPNEPGPIMNKGCPKVPGQDTVYIIKYITDTIYIPLNNNLDTLPVFIKTAEDLKQVFKYVKFEFDKYTLTSASKSVLDQVANYMIRKNDLRIQLTGHTDDISSHKYNLKLSENRVKAVQEYLSDKGILKSRITIDWKGETIPIKDNGAEQGREENRRVELEILNEK